MVVTSVEVKLNENTERITILEERVDKNAKKINETNIDVKGLKKDMSLMSGDIKILVEDDKKILDGIKKLNEKIPGPWYKRLNWYHWLLGLIVALLIIGAFS